jgi:hypothetical protein
LASKSDAASPHDEHPHPIPTRKPAQIASGTIVECDAPHLLELSLGGASPRAAASFSRSRRAHFEQRWQTELAEFSTQDLATAAAVLDRLRALYDDLSTDAHDESRPAGVKLD